MRMKFSPGPEFGGLKQNGRINLLLCIIGESTLPEDGLRSSSIDIAMKELASEIGRAVITCQEDVRRRNLARLRCPAHWHL
ncbi:hypothetical protein BDE02_08G135600 [Populus trichocarpa]|nr:hypothetical protein BDE02_08G135600 [Populus trichocarpa]